MKLWIARPACVLAIIGLCLAGATCQSFTYQLVVNVLGTLLFCGGVYVVNALTMEKKNGYFES